MKLSLLAVLTVAATCMAQEAEDPCRVVNSGEGPSRVLELSPPKGLVEQIRLTMRNGITQRYGDKNTEQAMEFQLDVQAKVTFQTEDAIVYSLRIMDARMMPSPGISQDKANRLVNALIPLTGRQGRGITSLIGYGSRSDWGDVQQLSAESQEILSRFDEAMGLLNCPRPKAAVGRGAAWEAQMPVAGPNGTPVDSKVRFEVQRFRGSRALVHSSVVIDDNAVVPSKRPGDEVIKLVREQARINYERDLLVPASGVFCVGTASVQLREQYRATVGLGSKPEVVTQDNSFTAEFLEPSPIRVEKEGAAPPIELGFEAIDGAREVCTLEYHRTIAEEAELPGRCQPECRATVEVTVVEEEGLATDVSLKVKVISAEVGEPRGCTPERAAQVTGLLHQLVGLEGTATFESETGLRRDAWIALPVGASPELAEQAALLSRALVTMIPALPAKPEPKEPAGEMAAAMQRALPRFGVGAAWSRLESPTPDPYSVFSCDAKYQLAKADENERRIECQYACEVPSLSNEPPTRAERRAHWVFSKDRLLPSGESSEKFAMKSEGGEGKALPHTEEWKVKFSSRAAE